jgi:hypothetical protein
MPKFAVLFYGLARSLKWTSASIKGRLLDKLSGPYRVFFHTYTMKELHNPRAAEYHLTLDPSDIFLLRASTLLVEDQDEVDGHLPFETFRAYGQPWPKQKIWNSLDNVSRQFYSLAQVWSLFENHVVETGEIYDYVVVARPDVEFLTDFTPADLRLIDSTHYLVPRFHWFNGGVNDRFLVARPDLAKLYCNRRAHAKEYCDAHGALHPECFVEWVMRVKGGASPLKAHLTFHRVRADGKAEPRDEGLRKALEDRKTRQEPRVL